MIDFFSLSVGLLTAVGSAGAASNADCPATALVAKWKTAGERLSALPEATRALVSSARETLSASCPVCREAPDSFAFLGRFLDATVALDGRIVAAFEERSNDAPEGIRSAFAERIAIGAKARELFGAFALAMAPLESDCCADSQPAKPDAARTGPDFVAIVDEARRLEERWKGVPARAAALPAETKAELLGAMEVFSREVETCDLAKETFTVLEKGLERLVAIDKVLAAHCEETSKKPGHELTAGLARLRTAAQARSRATADVAKLLHVMNQMLTPTIFDAKPATAVAGSRR